MLNIDVDTGGTMTDGLVSGDAPSAGFSGVFSVKVETTPHDVTIAFAEVLEAARRRVGAASMRDLLDEVALIRWSSTITSNVLAQKSGPKLGLLVSAGHEDDLYTSPEEAATVVGPLIDRDNITGIPEGASDDEIRTAVKGLFDQGIRRINISLRGAFADDAAEQKIVALVDAQYPDHYLGSIPALPASEILLRPDDATRTFVSLINAYVHPSLATTLYRAEETLKQEHSWRGNVLVGHINGGVARIGKTTAFDTIESGPLFGTHACAAEAARLGDAAVLAIDVGGTTAKVSAVEDGRVVDRDEGHLFGIPVRTNLPLLRSIALGGGSVARVAGEGGTSGSAGGHVTLGPDSMGAAPGPACYGLGGRSATATDAFVVLGLLSPTAFLEGRRTLDVDAARAAIDRAVGTPLGLSTEDAAQRIVDTALDMAAQLARDTAAEMGWDPADTAVHALGGNGPLLATGVAERLGASTVRLFGFGNVLSAYGSAISDVVHVYESAVSGAEEARGAAARLREEARRDLRGEGFDPDGAVLAWEVRDADGTRHTAEGDVDGTVDSVLTGTPRLVHLTARSVLPSLERTAPAGGDEPAGGERGGLPVHGWSSVAGQRLDGPVLVDGGAFTWFVGPGWSLQVDENGDATATRTTGGTP
ncbi:hydantoinase/oxoprolinase family protein [Actinomycetospora straminea]|uniref:N-methylhydantoinase A n=1 Tax=Actinomycetospora straminea TaxID=663607 RepID=A0ABP9EHZ7_9PSEU|nr:hydantoinase/oxoprolinase family protein [Actinomycetospora straminea]MDD7933848.1 hydantoinase/oxoprolinase family protein [Actinomycetospora straminea]